MESDSFEDQSNDTIKGNANDDVINLIRAIVIAAQR